MTNLRIQNQYLLSILSLVTQLGAQNVSSVLLVEAWKNRGRSCDDNFFMHFDVLHNYQFLKPTNENNKLVGLEELLSITSGEDRFVSITHEGQEFLHRYGGV